MIVWVRAGRRDAQQRRDVDIEQRQNGIVNGLGVDERRLLADNDVAASAAEAAGLEGLAKAG